MAGRGRAGRGTRRWAGPVLALLLLLTAACGAPAVPDTAAREVQRTLDLRAAAVLDRDEDAYLAALDPAASALRAAARREFANLADVPLQSWAYELTSLRRNGSTATARVELRYRLQGYDRAPVTAGRELELAEDDGRWYVAADRPVKGGTQQLWQQGRVTAVRGTHSLVLGVGRPAGMLRAVAEAADRAVPAVDAAWTGDWAGRVVVLVPGSLDGMASLLGAPAAGYRGIAAVTTGESGGSSSAPADRVIVNPEAYAVLGEHGRRTVLTHETAHVATRAHTSAATPLWLSEGFADWVAYRGTDRTAAQAAPELRRAVRGGGLPGRLPADGEFGFSGDADRLARAYEGGWLACRLIADRWGEEKLTAFYRAVGAHKKREGAVERAMDEVLSTTPEDFTAQWRAYLRAQLA
ncbi:hypothetical protein NLX86_04420 [Streptomyces sp. A3M-1-3]|uniref:hypothetical protein n=1 Tax=Streptomyces sp. A3M-1-3 TaxID=2962044 RepID=UPI0020B89579|nr:hypothetical protein [Streptomyces sp. A3M-1-3]MCP3817408.1 hypothetical protein [Streptomyces sp. A3M-1-3]